MEIVYILLAVVGGVILLALLVMIFVLLRTASMTEQIEAEYLKRLTFDEHQLKAGENLGGGNHNQPALNTPFRNAFMLAA